MSIRKYWNVTALGFICIKMKIYKPYTYTYKPQSSYSMQYKSWCSYTLYAFKHKLIIKKQLLLTNVIEIFILDFLKVFYTCNFQMKLANEKACL